MIKSRAVLARMSEIIRNLRSRGAFGVFGFGGSHTVKGTSRVVAVAAKDEDEGGATTAAAEAAATGAATGRVMPGVVPGWEGAELPEIACFLCGGSAVVPGVSHGRMRALADACDWDGCVLVCSAAPGKVLVTAVAAAAAWGRGGLTL